QDVGPGGSRADGGTASSRREAQVVASAAPAVSCTTTVAARGCRLLPWPSPWPRARWWPAYCHGLREPSRLLGEQLRAGGLELRPRLREQLGVDGRDGAAEEGRGGAQRRTGRLGVAELRGRLSRQFRELGGVPAGGR